MTPEQKQWNEPLYVKKGSRYREATLSELLTAMIDAVRLRYGVGTALRLNRFLFDITTKQEEHDATDLEEDDDPE